MARYTQKFQATNQKIMQAFVTLAKSKPVAKITVSDIIHVAAINRSTFYRHYLDKYDLVEKIENQVIADIQAVELQQNAEIQMTTRESLNRFLNTIKHHQPLLAVLISKNGDIEFSVRLLAVFYNAIGQTIQDMTTGMDTKQRDIMSAYYASQIYGIVLFWVHNFKKYDKEYVLNFILQMEFGK
jgi:AcrR family transcriptional regulator